MSVPLPRLVAWELTRSCNLRCRHCRANAFAGGGNRPTPGDGDELSLAEAKRVVDDIASFANPILILTGGEPLVCAWIWDLIAYARGKGLRSVIGTNATLVDDAVAARIAAAGVTRVSVSVDFPDAAAHDRFRGVPGAFDAARRGIRALQGAGVEVQVNSTVTKLNRTDLPRLHDLAAALGAKAFHPFLLVPTGRGADLADAELSAAEYEEALAWICRRSADSPLELKPTDAPQYRRIVCQMNGRDARSPGRGCLAGTGFAFIGATGDVQPCGYFDLRIGNVREKPFSRIWRESPVLDDLRHPERLKGKCGVCEYRAVCGGCRARALAKSGDYLAEEPSCVYVPDRDLLDRLQVDFPRTERPYADLGADFGLSEDACYGRVCRLKDAGLIRRVGASFDSRRLGHVSTLVAAKVAPERLDAVADAVSAFPEVTHNYARTGKFNLWFAMVARDKARIGLLLERVKGLDGVADVLELPAEKAYKLQATFSRSPLNGRDARSPGSPLDGRDARSPEVDLVRKVQGDILGLGVRPFTAEEARRLQACRADGTLRRLGAMVSPRAVGLPSNALTGWDVPGDRLDAVGTAFAAKGFVSHCYARRHPADWPYSLYAMVHAGSDAELAARLEELEAAARTAAGDGIRFAAFVTTHEYKKASPRYFVV